MKPMMHSGTACLAMLTLASTVAYAADRPNQSTQQQPPMPLSVAPLDHVDYPESRPTWVQSTQPNMESSLHTLVLVTQPCDTEEECEQELKISLRASVATYIKMLAKADHYDFFEVNDQWIDEKLVTRDYTGTVTKGDTDMLESAVELTFTSETQAEIKTAWNEHVVGDRLGVICFSVFVGLILMVCTSTLLCTFSRRAA